MSQELPPAQLELPPLVKTIDRIDRALAHLEALILSVLLVGLIVLACYQAYKRNIAPPSPYWPDELIRYAVFAIGLLGAALASQGGKLINIDMFTRLFSPRGRLIMGLVTTTFTIFVCIMLIKGGFHVRAVNLTLHEEGELITPATGILALPIGVGLIALHLALHAVVDVYYLVSGKTPPEKGPVVA